MQRRQEVSAKVRTHLVCIVRTRHERRHSYVRVSRLPAVQATWQGSAGELTWRTAVLSSQVAKIAAGSCKGLGDGGRRRSRVEERNTYLGVVALESAQHVAPQLSSGGNKPPAVALGSGCRHVEQCGFGSVL